ncbi:hypothetical protein E4U53_005287 [Claviceps sorghi]|nr:hypothetical protein E4U53_005287 [Claviceps sorghi]
MVGKTPASKNKSKRPAKTPNGQQSSTAQNPIPSTAHHDAVQSSKEQQTLLNIFSDAFAAVLSSDRFPTLLQEIKQALYRRDFATAFGKGEYLETYAARWSPPRALCYASVFLGIHHHVEALTGPGHVAERASMSCGQRPSEADDQDQAHGQDGRLGEAPGWSAARGKSLRMLCIGGCAAEHVAFASYLQATNRHGTLTLLDAGPWAHVASLLQSAVTTAPPLSKYASASARASNRALLATGQLDFAFAQADVLGLTQDRLAEVVGPHPQIVTLLFTLNELYTEAGIGRTTEFLTALRQVLPAGSLLLVVDSPGSYSEAAIGKDKKKYPMQWLLHHTLMQNEASSVHMWERLESHDSVWFRLSEELRYPIQLESMRYQMHLYRLLENSSD